MAEGKKSVLLYCDLIHTIEKMDNETAGLFFKHYLRYVNDLNPSTDNMVVDITFEAVKQNLKRDLVKWEGRADKSRLNGKLGGRPKNPNKPKEPSGLINNQDGLKKPVTVNVNVTDNVNVNDNVINKKKEKTFSFEVNQCYDDILQYFTNNLHPKNEKEKFLWLDTIEKLERIDEIPLSWTLHIVKRTREDVFWVKNFLSITKLRKKNSDGKLWAEVFIEKFRTRKAPEDIEMDRLRLKYTGNGQ